MINQKGFTIVEVLVVVMVISLVLMVTIVNFPFAKLQLTLSRVTYKFEQDVRRAQNMALSSFQYKDENGVFQEVAGYGVYVNLAILGNKKYIIYADTFPGNKQYDAFDYVIETVDFSLSELGIIIKQIDNVVSNAVSVNFESPVFDTFISQLHQNQNTAKFIFAIETKPEKTKSVWVNTSSLVEVK